MDTKYSVKYSDSSLDDIQQIHQYISTEFNAPYNADKVIQKIFAKIDSLVIMPERGKLYSSTPFSQLRSIKAGKYIIIYLLDKNRYLVEIQAVAHSRRNLSTLLKS